ncbi:MAG: ATP-binding protein [Euryarchaeota archaeon]|nr:ATP-binding protein [Euryarchaeota archaeon]
MTNSTLKWLYPASKKKLFTNRKAILKQLNYNIEQIQTRETGENIVLIGLRKIGKTLILKEFMQQLIRSKEDCVPVYLDLEGLSLEPRNFSFTYVGYVMHWFNTRGTIMPMGIGEHKQIYSELAKIGDHELIDHVNEMNYLDDEKIIHAALNFPELLANRTSTNIIILVDEFQQITEVSRNIIPLFRSVLQTQSRTHYLAAGSAVHILEKIFKEPESPLFLHFSIIPIKPFTRDDTRNLVKKVFGKTPDTISSRIFHLSFGHPFYIYVIAEKLKRFCKIDNLPLTTKLVDKAFFTETLNPDGKIYNICAYIFKESFRDIRKESIYRTILKCLAKAGHGTVTQIARETYLDTAIVGVYFNRLLHTDLVYKEGSEYFFKDSVLRCWMLYTFEGIVLDDYPSHKILEELIEQYREKFEKAASEGGLGFEARVRELLRLFNGQEVIISNREIELPTVVSVQNWVLGEIEVDALVRGSVNWIVECKYRGRQMTVNDLQKMLDKKQKVEENEKISINQLWAISKEGFKLNAVDFARENGIFISDVDELNRVARKLGIRGI